MYNFYKKKKKETKKGAERTNNRAKWRGMKVKKTKRDEGRKQSGKQ